MWCSGSDYTDDRRHALTGMRNDCAKIKLGGGDIIYGNFCLPKLMAAIACFNCHWQITHVYDQGLLK